MVATLEKKGTQFGADTSIEQHKSDNHNHGSQGSSIQKEDAAKSLNKALGGDDHNHAIPEGTIELQRTDKGGYKQQDLLKQGKLFGSDGNDFLNASKKEIKGTATGTGSGEFPFPNDSKGTTTLTAALKADGNLKIDGSFKDFDGAPLFSQGEKEIDPKAKILNGSDPKALVDGFLKVPHDVEGNPLSGTHLHFAPSGDQRGNNADATVVRFLDNKVNRDGKSGKISGDFKLKPEEQAAFAAGNLYVNVHSNVDVNKDGNAGFPTGENRVNFNQNVVRK
ncbi:hypothetical protein NIES2135_60750 (plasmid) [Leptolyngbya boryana NIES-2135]|jgi:hypothetical protein|uniref:CHRD domain-containing protein n=1 Tax=Leptolyngbya boryana NIES-2135 TaxID=1973484 RepID=A0A1Z4JRB8_LEPBY|nr:MULTISPECIES: CHRD domain-containing protein [Leptolyngbya]BAY59198.1 hypothetical protein NIES2135_60750 [Leptolyngbya boryana NIES-2135]MBD2372786.1 CHRD domain-containing protein [Leptolyngbya sp. FACHB-238]MBD2397462.1 CHRD domain-containing protein [Leptolyngbya sp. FACHB-239]MBD2403733.1 CHRD domain-containing protein [Leptolyngbya sp. FACHB-402]ULP33391.1 CHRD domain-containing protein [Leptolyngbya boryana IU 594]